MIADKASPLTYGYEVKELPVYFSQDPVVTVTGEGGRGNGYFDPDGPGARLSQNVTPNAYPVRVSPWQSSATEKPAATTIDPAMAYGALPTSRTGDAPATQHPRVVMEFPAKADDILLSGMLSGGRELSRKALLVDVPQGQGHMVLFALRPFWRWQTQGSYFLGFNAILNWDHLDAGLPAPANANHAAPQEPDRLPTIGAERT